MGCYNDLLNIFVGVLYCFCCSDFWCCFVTGEGGASNISKGDDGEEAEGFVAWSTARLCSSVSNSFSLPGSQLKAAWAKKKKQGVPPTLVPIEKSSSVSYFFGHDVVDSLVEKLSGGVYFSLEKRRKKIKLGGQTSLLFKRHDLRRCFARGAINFLALDKL